MSSVENDELLGPRLRIALRDGHVRRAAQEAGRELVSEQNDSVISIARVLGDIDQAGSRADLEARLVQLEEQVERLSARPGEADQAIESKIQILRTTIESALEAIVVPPAEVPKSAEPSAGALEALRKEFDVKLQAARSDLRFEIHEIRNLLEAAPTKIEASVDTKAVLEELEDRLYASEQRNASAAVYLEEMITAQRDRIDQLKSLQSEFVERMSKEFSNFMRTLAAPE
ncbi:hypothetical protein BH23ACT12_BH23ACT12_14080 [soil metagenome]